MQATPPHSEDELASDSEPATQFREGDVVFFVLNPDMPRHHHIQPPTPHDLAREASGFYEPSTKHTTHHLLFGTVEESVWEEDLDYEDDDPHWKEYVRCNWMAFPWNPPRDHKSSNLQELTPSWLSAANLTHAPDHLKIYEAEKLVFIHITDGTDTKMSAHKVRPQHTVRDLVEECFGDKRVLHSFFACTASTILGRRGLGGELLRAEHYQTKLERALVREECYFAHSGDVKECYFVNLIFAYLKRKTIFVRALPIVDAEIEGRILDFAGTTLPDGPNMHRGDTMRTLAKALEQRRRLPPGSECLKRPGSECLKRFEIERVKHMGLVTDLRTVDWVRD